MEMQAQIEVVEGIVAAAAAAKDYDTLIRLRRDILPRMRQHATYLRAAEFSNRAAPLIKQLEDMLDSFERDNRIGKL